MTAHLSAGMPTSGASAAAGRQLAGAFN